MPKATPIIDADTPAIDPATPVYVTLSAPYAYYDDAGMLHSWSAGQKVEDAADILLLTERGAELEV